MSFVYLFRYFAVVDNAVTLFHCFFRDFRGFRDFRVFDLAPWSFCCSLSFIHKIGKNSFM